MMENQTDHILVISNLPNRDSALQLAEMLVEGGLAACVNVLAPCVSIYHWQGKTERAEEIPVLVKTTRENYPAVESAIKSHHPYELPEIIRLPITGGLPAYLEWVTAETSR
ncbi:MAG: divalent-cation tolerance protein CutA [Methylobacillus sp.]|nr:divalent-cation tolerance protein CutA [Methylobacillus sp.]